MPIGSDKLVKIKQISGLTALLPTANEKAALAGVSAPGSTNKYATAADLPVKKVAGVTTIKNSSFDIFNSYAGHYVRVNTSTDAIGTILTYDSEGWADGTVIMIEQTGSGIVSIQGDSDVTVNCYGTPETTGQYTTLKLICVARDVWTVIVGAA